MALRAGYYGLKKKFINKVNKWDQLVFPRSEQVVLGAKNLLPYPYTDKGNKTDNGITFIDNGDGTITAKAGTATANAQYYIAGSSSEITRSVDDLRGKYFSKGLQSTSVTILVWYYDTNKSYISGQGATKDGVLFEIPTNAVYYSILIRVHSGTVIENDTDIKPMISLNGGDYVPYAMTNRELTVSAADQKTVINAIITAATSAADFAAFKTAMGAITPVTRSLNRTASPEDVPEEVIEEEKTVTKKTTRKTTVKEGE